MEHTTSATGQHDFPGGFPTSPGHHHHCTIELLLLFLIVYTGHFNCTWGGGLLCHMNSVIILNHEFCTYRRRRGHDRQSSDQNFSSQGYDRQPLEQNNRKLISLHNNVEDDNMHTDLQISSCWEHISTLKHA
jgi:hypothetical protein